MGEMIRTVLGDIKSEDANVCQCHEHLFIEMGKPYRIAPVLYMDDLEKSTDELKSYRSAGGSLVVDAQPPYAGRMAESLVLASGESGVHVVASTGFYKTGFYEPDAYIYNEDEGHITDLYVSEFKTGMVSSRKDGARRLSARAGMMKTAVDTGGIYADSVHTRLFSSAADAAIKTGMPVMCHIEQGADALHVVDFFVRRGPLSGQAADLPPGQGAIRLWLSQGSAGGRRVFGIRYHQPHKIYKQPAGTGLDCGHAGGGV